MDVGVEDKVGVDGEFDLEEGAGDGLDVHGQLDLGKLVDELVEGFALFVVLCVYVCVCE